MDICIGHYYEGDTSCYCIQKTSAKEYSWSIVFGILIGISNVSGLLIMKKYSQKITYALKTHTMQFKTASKNILLFIIGGSIYIYLSKVVISDYAKNYVKKTELVSTTQLITFLFIILINEIWYTSKKREKNKKMDLLRTALLLGGCLLGGIQMVSNNEQPQEDYRQLIERLQRPFYSYIATLIIFAILQFLLEKYIYKKLDAPLVITNVDDKDKIKKRYKILLFVTKISVAAAINSIIQIGFRFLGAFYFDNREQIKELNFSPADKLLGVILLLIGIAYLFKLIYGCFNQCHDMGTMVAFEGAGIIVGCITDYFFYQRWPPTISGKIETLSGATVLVVTLFILFNRSVKELKTGRAKPYKITMERRVTNLENSRTFYETFLGAKLKKGEGNTIVLKFFKHYLKLIEHTDDINLKNQNKKNPRIDISILPEEWEEMLNKFENIEPDKWNKVDEKTLKIEDLDGNDFYFFQV